VRLTVVGCAGSVPGPDSACSCYLVERDGYRLLLDLGTGAAGPLQRYAAASAIDAVIVSHSHADHWADLTHLGYLRTLPSDYEPLPVIGPSDMPAVLRRNPGVFAATVAEAGSRPMGPFTVRLARVEHGECWAARIDDALCYTADTAPCPALDELAKGCAILLAEASGREATGPMEGHLTAADAGRLAARSGTRLLILTHVRAWHDPVRLLDEAAALAGCPVVLAYPGLRVAAGVTG
jgi:ribonuclease BN (tRNA processing enzyme)